MLLQLTFIAIAFFTLLLFFLGTGKKLKVLVIGLLWMSISGMLSYYGFFQNTSSLPPRMLWILLPVIILTVSCYRKITVINVNYLIAVHIFRIPIEFILYQLFLQDDLPRMMTFAGWNFDIMIGISAIPLLSYTIWFRKNVPHLFFQVWNLLGCLSLLFIVSIAILSAPSPIQLLSYEHPNLALIKFPYTLLPAVIVPIVLLSHLFCLDSDNFMKDERHQF